MSSSYALTNGKVVQTSAGIGDPITAIERNIKKSHPGLDIKRSDIEAEITIYVCNLSFLGLENPKITKRAILRISRDVVADAEAEAEANGET